MAFGQDEDYADKPVEEGKTYEVEIDDVGSKGDGIARVEGFVVFVPETDIGDRVEVEINSVGRKFAFGEVQEHLGTVEDGEAADLEEEPEDEADAFGDEDASTLEEEEDDEWDMDADDEDEALEDVEEAAEEADDEDEAEEVVEEEAVEDALEDEADLAEDEAEEAAEEAVESLEDDEEADEAEEEEEAAL